MYGLGGNKLIYNESEDAYYIQHGADAALKKLGNNSVDTYISVSTSGEYPFLNIAVDISYNNKSTRILTLSSLTCHTGGSAYHTSQSAKHTVTSD